MSNADGTGPQDHGLGAGRGQGHRRGIKGGFGLGPDGQCRCPNCGHTQPHKLSVPCYAEKCPKCGAPMTRA